MLTRTARHAALALTATLGVAGCDQMPPAGPEKPAAPTEKLRARPADPPAAELFKVALGESPARGGAAPKVTLVAFSEFQCPFCGKVVPTLDQLAKTYGDDLRIVFKHRPLPFHDKALAAAVAAEAAGEQGKFWQMHDRLFANQTALDPASLEKYAGEIGLDVARWKAALDKNGAARARVDGDLKQADQLAVNGTPSFFLNGRPLVGALPIDRFKKVIDEEIARADQRLAAGVAREGLYAELTRTGLDRRPAGDRPTGQPGPGCGGGACPGAGAPARPLPEDDKIYKVDLGGAPVRGPRDAAVTVVVFSEFQCPFCKRVAPTLEALEKEFPGKVRIVWKNFPLEFHQNARAAAFAAHAAGQQGKFWQMHDRLLDNQQALLPADLEKYAQELGLDVARWKVAMNSPEAAALVDADVKQGQSLGIEGTPTLLINGRKVVGAQPLAALRPIVEQELAKGRR